MLNCTSKMPCKSLIEIGTLKKQKTDVTPIFLFQIIHREKIMYFKFE